MSEGQFCRLFKKLTGFTPFSYLNRYRIIKSCKYLTGTTKKVIEFAPISDGFFKKYFHRYYTADAMLKSSTVNYP